MQDEGRQWELVNKVRFVPPSPKVRDVVPGGTLVSVMILVDGSACSCHSPKELHHLVGLGQMDAGRTELLSMSQRHLVE